MDRLRPSPASHHAKKRTFVFLNLKDCLYVFLREEGVRASLKPPYTSPYEVLDRKEKTFEIKVRGQPIAVTIDRVKPAYQSADQQHSGSASSPTPPPKRTTTFGRHVRFPNVFTL